MNQSNPPFFSPPPSSAPPETVADIIRDRPCPVFAPDDKVADLIRKIQDSHAGAAAVLDGRGLLQGLITEREILRRVFLTPGPDRRGGDMTAGDMMIRDPVMLDDRTDIRTALDIITGHGFRYMPVIRHGQPRHLAGIVSERELFQHAQEKTRRVLESKDTLLCYFMHHEPYGRSMPVLYDTV